MKKILFTMLLLLSAATLSAQPAGQSQDDQYKSEVRSKLALDTTLPDYTTHKVDPKVMGPRLASILQELCANYKRSDYHSILSRIQCDQIEGLDYCTIEKFGLVSASKTGNTITIRFKTTLGTNPLDLKKSDLLFTFVDGVSERKLVNSLFTTLSRYLKD
jgi:hypothetical protein